MRIRDAAVFVASTVLALAGVAAVPSASAAESSALALTCSNPQYFATAQNAGASIRCTGGAFVAKLVCYKPSYGNYIHYGNRVESGGTSTVWCDTGATAQKVTGLLS